MKIVMNPRTEIAVSAALAGSGGVYGLFGDSGSGRSTLARYLVGKFSGVDVDSIANWLYFKQLDGLEIGIDSIRELQKFLQLTVPGKGKIKRAVIFKNFDSTSLEAQNALLKTIEEPPADTVILLTAMSELSILPTIVSRITRIPVLPVSKASVLSLDLPVTAQEIERIYSLSEGRIGTLSSLVKKSDSTEVMAISNAKQLLSLSKPERLSRIDSITKSKDIPPLELVGGILKIHRALLSARLQSRADSPEVSKAYENVRSAYEAFQDLKSGVNIKLVLSRLFIS